MSLITRCPVCGTLFKVVPDQLRISQGWVRCGQCAEIFDASADLRQSDIERVPEMPAAALPTSPVLEPHEAAGSPDGSGLPAAASDPVATIAFPAASVVGHPHEREHEDVPELDVDQAATPAPAVSQSVEPEAEDVVDSAAAADPIARAESAETAEPAAQDEPAAHAEVAEPSLPLPQREALELPAVEPVPEAVAEVPDHDHAGVSFIRRPVHEPRWRSSLRRAGWVFAGVALGVALLLQISLQERDRLAAAAPAALPWLQALCAPLKCRVQPLREIESVVIDGSSFNSLRNDAYRLNLGLRNRADHALALPAIELSLTDIQEQPVVRRVLLPTELAAADSVLPARGEWSARIDLALGADVGKSRIVGYRLLAFYP